MNPSQDPSDTRVSRRWRRTGQSLAVAAAATTIFTGVSFGQAQAATTSVRARVISWVDGDTVKTSRGEIRLIGMDTPERGERCYRQAGANAARLAPAGTTITLVKVGGRDNTDRYGRLLRYVQRSGVDVGYRQIVKGYADAAYDSGSYGTHPRRAKYHWADNTHRDLTCRPSTPPPPPPPPPSPSNCDASYPGVCIPPPPPDLDCGQISFRRFAVVGSDPHGFDSDGDGIGCESD